MSLVPAAPMLPTEDLFVYVYVLIHDLILAGRLPVGDCQHRSIRPRCRSSTRPGSAVRTSGRVRATTWPAGSAATPRRPSGSTGFRLAIKTGLGSRTVRPGPSCPPVPIACG